MFHDLTPASAVLPAESEYWQEIVNKFGKDRKII
jgi:hypothetical protein